jgi:uncharacterized NAD(P)/FAD-binding protein YdhS
MPHAMLSSEVDVAIVGGGFCGTMLAIRLAALSPATSQVALIDGASAFGNGVAFGTSRPEHLLNVPAGKMSAYPEAPDHFLNWLRANEPALTDLKIRDAAPADFVPRASYGRYLSSLLDHSLRSNGRISIVARRVVDIQSGDGVTLAFEDGATMRARSCVLAVGNEAPADPTCAPPSFLRSPVYIANPWNGSLASRIDTIRDVLLIGTGLTAIDVALSIGARNPNAQIVMLSRRGRLPQAHRQVSPYAVDLGEITGRGSIVETIHAVRSHIRRAQDAGSDWRAVVDALRPHTQRIWRELPPVAKRSFLRHARPHWEVHRHRAAPAVDAAIRRMLASGILRVHAGRLAALALRGGRAVACFNRRADGCPATLSADLVVNCTGPRGDFARSGDPLWRNLKARGAISGDTMGLGIEVETDGAVVDANGRTSHRLFALGSLRRGLLYESTAVPELRQQVKELAELLSTEQAGNGVTDFGQAEAALPRRGR